MIEELAAATSSGKASGYWGVLVNQSLGVGAAILAAVQRGQEVDKSIMNASTYMYVCQHNAEDDARYMAKKLGVPLNKIPRKPLHFLIWSPSKGILSIGHVIFRNSIPAFIKAGKTNSQLKIGSMCGKFIGFQVS